VGVEFCFLVLVLNCLVAFPAPFLSLGKSTRNSLDRILSGTQGQFSCCKIDNKIQSLPKIDKTVLLLYCYFNTRSQLFRSRK